MPTGVLCAIAYAALSAIGGLTGYAQARSHVSLVTGLVKRRPAADRSLAVAGWFCWRGRDGYGSHGSPSIYLRSPLDADSQSHACRHHDCGGGAGVYGNGAFAVRRYLRSGAWMGEWLKLS